MVDTKELGIIVTGNVDDVKDALNSIIELMDGLADKVINVSTNIDSSQLEDFQGNLDEIDGTTAVADIEVSDNGSAVVENVEGGLAEIDGTSATAEVDVLDNATPSMENIQTVADTTAQSIEQIGTAGTIAGDEVSVAMQKTINDIQTVGDSAKDASDKVEDVGNKSEDVGDKAESGFGQAELAVIAFLGTLELTARELDDLNIKFDKMSNMAGSIPEGNMRDMVADISNVSFSADEVLAYITALKQAGVTSEDALKRGADAMDIIQEGTGATQEETIKFLNSLVVMGVNLEDIGTAYNAIAYAQGNVIGGFSNYIGWMQKYDAEFKKMGLNIDQTAVLVAGATKKFGGGRAAYSALNSAIKESNGDLTVLEQKLGMQPGSLENASASTAKYTGKLEKNREEVREHSTAIEKSGAVVEDAGIKYGDTISMLSSAGAIIGGVLGSIYIGIPGIIKILDSLWGKEGVWIKKYTDFVKYHTGQLKSFGGKVADIFRSWWPSWEKEAEKGTSTVTKKLGSGLDDVAKAGEKGGRTVVDILDSQGNKIGETTVKIGDDVLEKTPEVGSKLGQFFLKLKGFFEAGFTKLISLAPDWVTGVGRAIVTQVGKLGLGDLFASVGRFALPKIALVGDVAFVAGLEQIRAGLVDMAIDAGGTNTEIGRLNASFLSMFEGLQYIAPVFGSAIASLDILNGVIDNLLQGKGWDSFGNAINDLRARFDRDAQGMEDTVKRVFGVEIPDYMNPVDIMGDLYTFNFQDMWDKSIFSGKLEFPDISGGASNFLSTLASWMSIENLLGSVVSGWDGLLDYLQGIPDRILGAINGISWSSIGAGLGDAIAWVLENIYYLLKGLTELPGKATVAIQNFGSSIYNGLMAVPGKIGGAVSTVTNSLNGLWTFLSGLPGRATVAIQNFGTSLYNGIIAVPGQVQAGLGNIQIQFDNFVNYLWELPGKLVESITKGFNDMVNYIYTIPDKVTDALNAIVDRFWQFLNYLASLPGQFYDAIVNAFNGFIGGLSSKFPEISYWLGKIADLFPHSPPKAGPLIDIMDWGGNMADAIGTGISDNFPVVASEFERQLANMKGKVDFSDINTNSLAIPSQNLEVMNASIQGNLGVQGTTGGQQPITIQSLTVTVPLDGAVINSELDANRVGEVAGRSTAKTLKEELLSQANRGGVSVLNKRRM